MALKISQVHESKTLATSTLATLQVPVGGKIHSLCVRFATAANADATVAAIKSEISNVRLAINGKDVINCSPTKLYDLLTAMGQNVDSASGVAGMLELNLGRLLFTDPAARDLFGFGTNDVQSIQVQIMAGTLSTISSAQCFTQRESVSENLGMYFRYINYVASFNATGDHTVDTLPRDPDATYFAVLADAGASGVIYSGECRVNNITVKEKCPVGVNKQFISADRYTQPTGYFAYMFTDGNIKSRLPMVGVNDLRFIQNFTTAPGAAGYNLTALTLVNMPANI